MTDFKTWDRATLEQFAREARDKLVAMAQAEPVAWGNFKDDGTCVGLSQHPEDIARWMNPKPLYTSAPSIPEGWQLIDTGWLRAVLHVNALKIKPTASHQEVLDEIDRLLAAAPKHTPNKEQA